MITSLRFSPNGRHLYSTSVDKRIGIWYTFKGSPVHILCGHEDIPSSTILSPDETRVVGLAKSGELSMFTVARGQHLGSIKTAVKHACFSRDGGQIVTVHTSGIYQLDPSLVIVRDLKSGEIVYDVSAFQQGVVGVQVTPDNQYLVGCSIGESRVLIHDFQTGELVAICPTLNPTQIVASSSVTAQGKIALALQSGEVQVHEIQGTGLQDPVVNCIPLTRDSTTGDWSFAFRCCVCGALVKAQDKIPKPITVRCTMCRVPLQVRNPFLGILA